MAFTRKKINKNNKLTVKKKVGRPTKYNADLYPAIAKQIIADWGLDDRKLANVFKVNEATIIDWRKKHEEFSKSIKEGKDLFDHNVMENSCLKRAMGYNYTETSVVDGPRGTTVTTHNKHMPPDPTSFIFWLKNRNPDRWGDVWRKKLNEDSSPKGNTYIQILGKIGDDDIRRIREIVRAGIPAASSSPT